MTNLQTGIVVTLGVIIFNLVVFSLMPLSVRKIISIKKINKPEAQGS